MKRWWYVPCVLFLVMLACGLPGQTSEEATESPGAGGGVTVIPPPVVTPGAALEFCSGVQPPFITTLDILQTPDMDEPPARQPFRDPVFGTCLVRVTDRNADALEGDSFGGMKNEYSRVESFNADGSRLLVRTTEGVWYVYDALSLTPLARTPVITDPRWDADNPDLLYYFDMGMQMLAYNVVSGENRTVHDFSDDVGGRDVVAVWMRFEGSPSLDGRYWALMAQNSNWDAVALLVYDLQEDTVTLRDLPGARPVDSVTMSPLGTYLLAQDDYCESGETGSAAHPCGLMVWDRDLENARGLLRIIGHSDTALDANGNEVMIFQNIDRDAISMLDLASGEVTDLFPIDFSHTPQGFHFSGLGTSQPGWALVSAYNGGVEEDYTWMDDSVFALELKAGGRVVRLAHTHSLYDENQEHDYWAEPQVSTNRDLTRILFTSNWGRTGTDEVDLYMIVLPEGWPDLLP